VSGRTFWAQVEARIRLTQEIFEDAFQALVVKLTDDELEALLAEEQATAADSNAGAVPQHHSL
jgi:hypothetical protein